MKAVVLSSGGMDSTTLLWDKARELEGDVLSLSVDYGQRHVRELVAARTIAKVLEVKHRSVDLRSVGQLLKGSALSDPTVDVPEGHYADDSMRATIVPNRNTIMLSVAVGIAIAEGQVPVYSAVHAGDYAVYPDCRPEFVRALNKTIALATESTTRVLTPYIHLTKAEIASIGNVLGVQWDLTWTCYQGGEVHCGRCGTCTERMEAFEVAGVHDPTVYADRSAYDALRTAGRVG